MVMNKTFRNIVLALFLFYVLPLGANKHKVSYAKLVNTMIGTKGTGWASGYTYPGATYPLEWYSLLVLIFVLIWDSGLTN